MPDRVGLVMEYVSGGDLHSYISRHGHLKEHQARWVFQQAGRLPAMSIHLAPVLQSINLP